MSIIVDHLYYRYDAGTAFEKEALTDINMVINDGEFVGIIGHTGSGKSTLIQHLNGLLKPAAGSIYYNGEDIFDKGYSLKELRRKVGLVFQYPEYQLFESTVINDVKFGPSNLGLSNLEVDLASFDAIKKVGIPDNMIDASPFELSGGEKRKVAIAGILAMKPEVIILDEPTAGLDPKGREDILSILKSLHREMGMTIILVSHSMDEVADVADRLVVMNAGKIVATGAPAEIFKYYDELENIGLSVPQTVYLMNKLKKNGIDVRNGIFNPDDAIREISRVFHI